MKIELNGIDYPIRQTTIDDYFFYEKNPNVDDMTLISRMTGCKMEELKKVPFTQIKFVASVVKTQFASDDVGKLDLVITFKGKNYGLIKPSEISYEEWVNLEVFLAEKPVNLKRLTTHLYRPTINEKIGEDRELIPYSLDECMARENEFGEFPMNNAISALFFLTTFVQEYTQIILSSMETKTTEERTKNERKKQRTNHKK